MTDLAETATYEPGIRQLETTDMAIGGDPAGSPLNAALQQLANRAAWLKVVGNSQWAQDPALTEGLTYGFRGGVGLDADGNASMVAGGSVELADDSVQFVERSYAGVVTVNSEGFTRTAVPLAKVTTAGGAIVSVEDWRPVHGPFPFFPPLAGEVGVADLRFEDLRRFAPKANGVDDDAEALQNLILSQLALGRKECVIPAGVYGVSHGFSLPAGTTGFTIRGAPGLATQIIMLPGFGPAARLFDLSGTSANRTTRCTIASLYITGQGDPASDGVAIYADYTNGFTVEDVFVDTVRNAALVIPHAWDFHSSRFRTYGTGSDETGRSIIVGDAVSVGSDNSNTARFVDCTIERFYGVGLELTLCTDVAWICGKIHGRAVADADAALSRELAIVDGATLVRFNGTLFAQCRTDATSGAIRLLSTAFRSTLTVVNSAFDVIGNDDTYCVDCAVTDPNSKLVLDNCIFNDQRLVTPYVRIAATAGANTTRLSSNSHFTAGMELNDLRGYGQSMQSVPGALAARGTYTQMGPHGQTVQIAHAEVTLGAADNVATLTAAGLIPAGAIVLGVSTRCTVAFSNERGLTSMSIGDGTTPDLWAHNRSIAAGTGTANGASLVAAWTGPRTYQAAHDVVVTANGGNFGAAGQIRISVHYLLIAAATS